MLGIRSGNISRRTRLSIECVWENFDELMTDGFIQELEEANCNFLCNFFICFILSLPQGGLALQCVRKSMFASSYALLEANRVYSSFSVLRA
jgi:hypothetical protein